MRQYGGQHISLTNPMHVGTVGSTTVGAVPEITPADPLHDQPWRSAAAPQYEVVPAGDHPLFSLTGDDDGPGANAAFTKVNGQTYMVMRLKDGIIELQAHTNVRVGYSHLNGDDASSITSEVGYHHLDRTVNEQQYAYMSINEQGGPHCHL